MKTATTKWTGGMQFVARADSGHAVVMDASPEVGGEDTGSRPGELSLMALGTCTGMDVVSLLQKMKVSFSSLEIEVKARAADEHPKVWTEVWIKYKIKGDVPRDKLEKAIGLSQDKYCSIGALFRKAAKVHYDYEIL